MPSMEWDVDVSVLSVVPANDCTVDVSWSDGTTRKFDVGAYLQHCPSSWQRILNDDAYFRQVKVSEFGDTIEWPGGEDVAPEALYERVVRFVAGA